MKINPDIYVAAVSQAKANYESSLAAKASAVANLEKAQADYDRNVELFHQKLLSESDFIGFKSARNVARAQLDSADDMVNVAKAKKLSNMRSSGSDDATRITPPREHTLEQALEYIENDELVEVTPNFIRMRKRVLDSNDRKKSEKRSDS